MNKQWFLSPAILFLVAGSVHADTVSRRAAITGGGGPGRCTVEVNIDHTAEVEIFGDQGNLKTLGGQPAFWRRFECNVPLPQTPHDFQIARVNGRGQVRLLKDPSSNRGVAVVHISDPKAGRGVYLVDIAWRIPGSGWGPGAGPSRIEKCQNAVSFRLNRDGYQVSSFGRIAPQHSPGPNDWISGEVIGRRGFESRRFSFSCTIERRSGQVRHVDVRRHDPQWSYQ
jgi:hypothetical protein